MHRCVYNIHLILLIPMLEGVMNNMNLKFASKFHEIVNIIDCQFNPKC